MSVHLLICGPLHQLFNFPGFEPGSQMGPCADAVTDEELWCAYAEVSREFADLQRRRLPNDAPRFGIAVHFKHTQTHPRPYQILGMAYRIDTAQWYTWYAPRYFSPDPRTWLREVGNYLEQVEVGERGWVPRFRNVGLLPPEEW